LPRLSRRKFLAVGAAAAAAASTAYMTKDYWLRFLQGSISPSPSSSPIHIETKQSPGQQSESRNPSEAAIERIEDVSRVCKLTGYDSINKTASVGIYGTDLGIMAELDGQMYFAFGDTFNADWRKVNPPNNLWRSNTLAKTRDLNASDGITFDSWITDNSGKAKEILGSEKTPGREDTVIPTAMTSVDNRLFIHYMSVRQWGEPGNWTTNYSGLAYSDDKGNNFTKDMNTRWGGGSNFSETAFAKIPSKNNDGTDDVLMWGTPAGRFGGVKLTIVNEYDLLDKSKYRYFIGTEDDQPKWSPSEDEAVTIIDKPVGEMSVQFNEFINRWIILHTVQQASGGNIVMKESKYPWGPWSYPHTLVSLVDAYGPFMHSKYFENKGETIYLTLSSWGEYNVYLYKATLLKRR
jgi:hypothetical protein